MPFKDSPEGMTHHGKDSCYKCKMCGNHFFSEDLLQIHLCVDVEILKNGLKKVKICKNNMDISDVIKRIESVGKMWLGPNYTNGEYEIYSLYIKPFQEEIISALKEK